MSARAPRSSTALPPPRHESIPLGSDGSTEVRLRIYGCAAACADTPLVLHFHAGAFVGGTLDGGTAVARLLVEAGAAVASIDYPLAPEHPFPSAVEASYAALQWIERRRRSLAKASAPLFVAGEEAGGNLAAAVALVARDRGGPALAGQVLLSPMLDQCVATESQRRAKAGPVGCAWADGWRAYLSRANDALHPYATPGAALRLAGLPSSLLVTAQDDALRDETSAYAERLRAAGVPAELCVLPGPTGWPRSYLQPDATGWAPALLERLRPFLLSNSSHGASR